MGTSLPAKLHTSKIQLLLIWKWILDTLEGPMLQITPWCPRKIIGLWNPDSTQSILVQHREGRRAQGEGAENQEMV